MCGICGFTSLNDRELLRKMCNIMKPRGPDSEGHYLDGDVGLGVRRLSIIDLKTGEQPIHNEDSSIWIVFNGEIYNFKQLRRDLETRGHHFYTGTDTEVLIHLYEDRVEDLVHELRGMFAFAIYDANVKKLFLARDRFGKKPIYYTVVDNYFVFASELKAILQHEAVCRRLNLEALVHYLTYFYNPLDESMLKGVYRLPPAHLLTLDIKRQSYSVRQYWDLSFEPELAVDEEEALKLLDRFLTEAVRLRLVSDVPLGVLLSGGVDSSVVTGIMARLADSVDTFCVGFEGAGSEMEYAKGISELFDTDHHEEVLEPDVLKILPEIVFYLDEPVADPSIIPTFYICQQVRRHVKVCLTGEGGDELFWGYPWLQDSDALEQWYKVPKKVRKIILKIGELWPGWLENRLVSKTRDLWRYEQLGYGSLDPAAKCVARLSHFTPHEVEELNGSYADTWETYLRVLREVRDPHKARAHLTVKKVLPNDFLFKDDRLSMANSLELRSPLLDHALAEAVARFPSHMKCYKSESKRLLKRYAVEHLGIPKEIIYRPKGGFSFPIERWSRELRLCLEDEFAKSRLGRNVFGAIVHKTLVAKPSYENANRVLALLVLYHWIRLYVER